MCILFAPPPSEMVSIDMGKHPYSVFINGKLCVNTKVVLKFAQVLSPCGF